MAVAKKIKPEDAVINGNPLMRAEVDRFVENSQKVSSYQKISEYMFWGATTVLAGLIACTLKIGGMSILGASGIGLPLAIGGAVAGVATLAGSVFYSRKAAAIESNNAVLQSDIDSQNQARRMVQAFAKVQAPDVAPEGATMFSGPKQGGWAERVGGGNAERASGSWVHRVEAQRQAEEVAALDALNAR